MKKFDFNNLFVLDLANNHQGNLNHGLKIIRECSKMVHKHKIRAAIKFQFRQYDSFIHPNHKENSEIEDDIINKFIFETCFKNYLNLINKSIGS